MDSIWNDIRAVLAFYCLNWAMAIAPDDGMKALLHKAILDYCNAESRRIGAENG